MAQFDVYRHITPKSHAELLVDVQSGFLDGLETRIVIPMYRIEPGLNSVRTLNPIVEVSDVHYFLSTSELAAIHRKELSQKVGSLIIHRSEIIAALAMLFTGI
ncbi:MAG: CcdB family protein [Magnetococcales bacterium]|nr:CcdB family protein [Magnetococcales bacterium]